MKTVKRPSFGSDSVAIFCQVLSDVIRSAESKLIHDY